MPPKGSKAVSKKPRAAGKGPGPSNKTTVPDLAQAEGVAMEKHDETAGARLKKPRLLSQGVRKATPAAGAVQEYTLLLGDKAQLDDPKLMAVLNSSRLLRLIVTVPPSACTGEHPGIMAKHQR